MICICPLRWGTVDAEIKAPIDFHQCYCYQWFPLSARSAGLSLGLIWSSLEEVKLEPDKRKLVGRQWSLPVLAVFLLQA